MPKRKDIKSILVIGAGPIIIGQACEFDYSGTQACKALRSDGYRIILINSNPATIMTDPDVADKTYIEPITTEIIEEIIKKEKPDAIRRSPSLVLRISNWTSLSIFLINFPFLCLIIIYSDVQDTRMSDGSRKDSIK